MSLLEQMQFQLLYVKGFPYPRQVFTFHTLSYVHFLQDVQNHINTSDKSSKGIYSFDTHKPNLSV